MNEKFEEAYDDVITDYMVKILKRLEGGMSSLDEISNVLTNISTRQRDFILKDLEERFLINIKRDDFGSRKEDSEKSIGISHFGKDFLKKFNRIPSVGMGASVRG